MSGVDRINNYYIAYIRMFYSNLHLHAPLYKNQKHNTSFSISILVSIFYVCDNTHTHTHTHTHTERETHTHTHTHTDTHTDTHTQTHTHTHTHTHSLSLSLSLSPVFITFTSRPVKGVIVDYTSVDNIFKIKTRKEVLER